MKKLIYILFVFIHLTGSTFAQNNTDAVRFIKVGNTLREAGQMTRSLDFLIRGLQGVKQARDQYWEAVAYENLGLLYRDQNDDIEAIRNFQKARSLYKTLGLPVSEDAIRELMGNITGEDLFAGIDIGSSGIKLVALGLQLDRNGYYRKKVRLRPDPQNVSLLAATAQSFQAGRSAIRAYVDTLRRHSIAPERVFIAFSSGLTQELDKQPGKKRELYSLLSAELAGTGLSIDTTITPAREAQLFAIGEIPRPVWLTSSSFDIGSSNTKGGYFTSAKEFRSISFPVGTKSFAKMIENGRSLDIDAYRREAATAIKAISDTNLNKEFNIRNPGLQQRKMVALSGGIMYALVTLLHPDKVMDPVVRITLKDAERFRRLAITDYQTLTHPDLTDIADPAVRDRAQKNITQVLNDIFNEKQIIAGSLLLETYLKAFSSTSTEKQFTFIRDSDISWISGKFVEAVNKDFERKISAGGR